MQYFYLNLVVLAVTFGFIAPEPSPDLPSECFYGEGGYNFTRYIEATVELDGLCDKSAIDERDLEYALTDILNSALECPWENDYVDFEGDLEQIICYPAVLISDINVTENSLSNCKLEVSFTTEVGLEKVATYDEDNANREDNRNTKDDADREDDMDDDCDTDVEDDTDVESNTDVEGDTDDEDDDYDGDGSNGECGRDCPTNYFLPLGGSFRRNLLRHRLRGKKKGVKSCKSSKSSKSTKAPKNGASSKNGRELFYGDHCFFYLSLQSKGYDVSGVQYKDRGVVTSVCETKFACVKDSCTKPGGDVCNGIL